MPLITQNVDKPLDFSTLTYIYLSDNYSTYIYANEPQLTAKIQKIPNIYFL